LISQNLVFVAEHLRKIYFDPAQRRWKRHSIRSGIETRGKIDYHVRAALDLASDEFIYKKRADRERPGIAVTMREAVRDCSAVINEKAGERISNEGVSSVALVSPVCGGPMRSL
jgi:hypothetical protein